MIIVRESFVAKPGMAGKMARMMKGVLSEASGTARIRVLTDMTGKFNQVVIETELDNLQAFEQRMHDYMANPAWRDKMSGYTEMYQSGKREIFNVV